MGDYLRVDVRYRAIRFGALLAIGAIWVLVARLTTPPGKGDDFADSPLFLWGFLLLPAVAFFGARARFEPRPLAWAALIPLPAALWTLLGGTVFFDDDQGASFWIVGEMFLLVLSVFVGAGAALGTWAARLGRSKSSGFPSHDGTE